MTKENQVYLAELNRTDSKNIPVNLIYPADYPNSPAIMLPEVLSPTLVLKVLERFTPK